MKRKITGVLLVVALALALGLVPAASVGATNGSTILLDSVNIGDTTSETGHNLLGWSNEWVKPGWGGGYGGGSADGSFRLLMGPGDGCGTGYEDAYFTMSAGAMCADKLVLHHLDGSQPDDFDVYILDGGVYIFIGDYAQQTATETWETSEYYFSPRVGEIQFKLVATSPIASWCVGWGQVAFSWAELYGPHPVTIDIKPGSDPNSINPDSNGVVPVAILGSASFDADTVNPFTVMLAGAEVRLKGKSGNAGSLEDVNGDGYLDLVVQVYTNQLMLESGEAMVVLTAYTYGGVLICGTDTVNVVP